MDFSFSSFYPSAMPVLDFKEIRSSNTGGGKQDSFELFARDFLSFVGLEVIEHPSRGPDGGRDLIVRESRRGVAGTTAIRWLVSCKHNARSGKAVGINDEPSVLERAEASSCQGFLGFYSTLPSTSLVQRLKELRGVETKWFDCEQIETRLMRSAQGLQLAKRYFPRSIARWKREHPKPAKLVIEAGKLLCRSCGRDLLRQMRIKGPARSLGTFWKNEGERGRRIDDLYWTCKNGCDFQLAGTWKPDGLCYTGWADLSDFRIPTHFLRTVMVFANKLYQREIGGLAFEKFKTLLCAFFPLVARDLTTKEEEELEDLVKYFW